MSETSRFWTTDGTGDGPSGGYTQQQFLEFVRSLFIGDKFTTEGVLKNVNNGLAVSSPSATNIDVATGAAIVYGFYYENTTVLALSFSAPAANTGGRVVLEVNWTAQTVRGKVILNTSGVTDPPALTQSAGTTWQISLASFVADTSGNVTNLTDERDFANFGTSISNEMLEDGIITLAKMAANSVGSSQIVTGAVTDNQLGADSVTNAKIATGAVGSNELATGAVTNVKLGADSVDSTKIADNAIGSEHIQADAVGSSEIAANAVGSSEIAANAVGSSEIATGAVNTDEIAADAVTPAKIPNRTRKILINLVTSNATQQEDSPGIRLPDSVKTYVTGGVMVPDDFASGASLVLVGHTGSISQTIMTGIFNWAAIDQPYNTHTDSYSNSPIQVTTANDLEEISLPGIDVSSLAAGDFLEVYIERDGTHGGDNNNTDFYIVAMYLEYTADS